MGLAVAFPGETVRGINWAAIRSFMRSMVCPIGFEPMTYGLEIRCSIQLSYGHKKIRLLV